MFSGLSRQSQRFGGDRRLHQMVLDAYGKQTCLAANGTVSYAPSDYGQFVGFTGRYHDWETGLVYFRARYFDAGLGRFIGRDPVGYLDGTSLYNGYFVPNDLDPTGLRTKAEAEKWITDHLPSLNKEKSGDCNTYLGALAAMYVELRRGSDFKDSERAASAFMYTTLGGLGNSYGSEAFKPKDAEVIINSDTSGVFKAVQAMDHSSKDYRNAVYDILVNHPMEIVSARIQFYIDQWNAAHDKDPSIADISQMPGILATLYNLGPAASHPKATPQNGGSWFTEDSSGNLLDAKKGDPGAKNFGDYAAEFGNSPFGKKLKADCDCMPKK